MLRTNHRGKVQECIALCLGVWRQRRFWRRKVYRQFRA